MMIHGGKIIEPLIKPKYKKAARGSYHAPHYGILYFRSGKDIVYIMEHFSDKNGSIAELVERTVRFDGETKKGLENGGKTCYNTDVNDVL